MFKNLQSVDFSQVSVKNIHPSQILKSNKIALPAAAFEDLSSFNDIAMEGLFGKSKEQLIKEFKDHWENYKINDLDDSEKMLKTNENVVSSMKSNVALFKTKLHGKKLNLDKVRASGLTYTDLLYGLEGTKLLPQYIQKIFSISPAEIFKNANILYTAIKSPPPEVKRTFVVDFDRQLTFRPEYHYRNGSKIHEAEPLDTLGYTEQNIFKLLTDVEACLEANQKLVSMFSELKRHWDEFEAVGIAAINNGDKGKYWSELSNLTHVISPLWFEATAYSVAGFTSKAMIVLKEIAAIH